MKGIINLLIIVGIIWIFWMTKEWLTKKNKNK